MRKKPEGAPTRAAAHHTHWKIAAAAAALAGVVLGLGLRRPPAAQAAPASDPRLAALRAHSASLGQAARQLDHDMRAPVGAMAVALEIVRTTDDADLRAEAMQVLDRQVARMTTLTQRLHEIAQAFEG